MSLRAFLGTLVYDWPRFFLARFVTGWATMRNRRERVESDGQGWRCDWKFTSSLHLARVFPSTGARLLTAALSEWPILLRDAPEPTADEPEVTFVIGHRGLQRLPHLLATLKSIAGQTGAAVECVVVEQSQSPEITTHLPSWVRYVHTPTDAAESKYNRAWTLNAGAAAARGSILILHDNDMLVPSRYAAETLARIRRGAEFLDLKRFTFYISEQDTRRFFETGEYEGARPESIIQNLRGASVVATHDAYDRIGGFDEEFVGWGGEDDDFWDRAAAAGTTYEYSHLPFIHLFHQPQKGKLMGAEAPAVQRYHQIRDVSPDERIRRLRKVRGLD